MWIGEARRVAVRGTDHYQDEAIGGNGPTVHRHFARRLAKHDLAGRAVPHDFLDRGAEQSRIVAQTCELIAMVEKAEHRGVDEVRGRLGSSREEELEESEDLF